MTARPKLLVSVRSADEAMAALRGGADLIDVKEPLNGPLGKASDHVIAHVLDVVDGRRPVSAAFGEWCDDSLNDLVDPRLTFVKWGLAGRRGQLAATYAAIGKCAGSRAVLVHYADAELAKSPSLDELRERIAGGSVPLVLIDTVQKNGRSLLDWIAPPELSALIAHLHRFGTRVAVAGSLDASVIPHLVAMRPDWIAVRGAACVGGRAGAVSEWKVAALADMLGNVLASHERQRLE